ncbi:hypothetical protein [Brevundimonas sp.]|uniref:hypothetical protein n=1 Tax=Brevundimonas sp. TaxID=1871086 RepID=UPI001D4C37BA|nr:hypothetical protein [Brevundimonas sp.]MBL0947509.1 hypothetical protein [Brevundimonas sp.]
MYLVDQTRRGLDADMNHLWATRTPLELLVWATQIGGFGVVVIALSFWLSRLLRLNRFGFVLLTSVPIPIALLLAGLWPSTSIAEPYAYPPTWLFPVALWITLAAAATSYLWVADAEKAKV